jgi:peroxiredoxin
MKKMMLSLFLLGAIVAHAESKTAPLKVGDSIPDVTLRTEADKAVTLRSLTAKQPTVLIFYRGGWCPYCSRQLKDLAGIENDLKKAGAQLLAISMDQPSKLRETRGREKLGYQLLSDSDAIAIKAFGLAFKVDDATVEKYKGYKIDLDAASGRNHHLLPHPAVYVVNTNGVICFAHVDSDYKVRLEPAKILEAVGEATY